jgi:hypothetical protein
MNHYSWTNELRPLYDHALASFRVGERDPSAMFSAAQKESLAGLGLRPINLFDYAEDYVGAGEPDWETVVLIVAARRDYFLYELDGQWPEEITEERTLPAKTDEWEGIAWLPRITTKARCFLAGHLCPEIMYCCGGDRRFLRSVDLHPADFLRAVWASHGNDEKVVRFVQGSTAG